MDERAFWQQKLIQFFHDPPGKPFASLPGAGGLGNAARTIFDAFQQHGEKRRWRYWYKAGDWAAAGADRPNLYIPKEKGISPLGNVNWPTDPLVTHPLAPNQRVRIPVTRGTRQLEDPLEGEVDPNDLLQEQVDAAREIGRLIGDWNAADRLRDGFVILWRRLREELVGSSQGDPLWNVMPAESRCPDHSIWDHLKVVTALAFMKPHGWKDEPGDEGAREPWMLRMTLSPVGRFIEQSRTTRDLWVSSYLLADLAFAALLPFIEQYGPDCIVYPDLFRNPRFDCWLRQKHPDALAEGADPLTFAAVLPQSFVVLAPRGGTEHLRPIEALAEEARQRMAQRWGEYMAIVKAWFEKEIADAKSRTFQAIWERQAAQCPIYAAWTALPWKPPGRLKDPSSLRRPALPAQGTPAPLNEADVRVIEARAARLEPWVPKEAWSRYEQARDVFAHSYLDMFQIERGFDYALTHQQLGARHAIRLQTHPAPLALEEPGEKCTLCGLREALHAGAVAGERLGQRRQSAREFWRNKELDPDKSGVERLCAVCATKRFLIQADTDGSVFNQLWAGKESINAFYRDGKARVPFPSTATIAAQVYLEHIVRKPEYEERLRTIVDACREAGLGPTSFPNALPRLAACKRDDVHRFLEYEAEDVLFPEALDGKIQESNEKGNPQRANQLKRLRDAVQELRGEIEESPSIHVAIVRLDGDHMGRLLLGEAEAIAARWRDVLHPSVLERLPKREHLMRAGWGGLLEAKRLMGPTLHALISRVLSLFAHRIAPFVVEREFSGRLIYAGGDDVLAIVPAEEAIDLVARLQQIFSAAWVLDTQPQEKPWAWRHPRWQGEYEQDKARRRFLIPLADANGEIDLAKPWASAAHVAGDSADPVSVEPGWRGELLPLLGRGASLSAGVAIGHYKTPLSVLLRRSKELQKLAKEAGRGRVGFGHASRGGEKSEAVLPWGEGPSAAHRIVGKVVNGFRNKLIPSRLPYKLREVAPALLGVGHGNAEDLDKLCRGLFRACLSEGDGASDAAGAALRLWVEGVQSCNHAARASGRHDADTLRDAIGGLLFCRELAGLGGAP
jgi:CRISPR-associated protein Cmr2